VAAGAGGMIATMDALMSPGVLAVVILVLGMVIAEWLTVPPRPKDRKPSKDPYESSTQRSWDRMLTSYYAEFIDCQMDLETYEQKIEWILEHRPNAKVLR
jgi:hypothetical protein